MKVAIFDAFSGASGDMIVASLFGISLTRKDLQEIANSLKLEIEFKVFRVTRKGIVATRIEVEERRVERSFEEVAKIVERSELDEKVKSDAIQIFKRIDDAESRIHGRKSVFHEVGSDDAIFDVVAAVTGIRRLIEKGYTFYATPIRLGSGFIEFSHGKYPVPAPATLEILKGSKLEVVFDGNGELLTPTAAAILSYYCKKLPKTPISVENITYGAGKYDHEIPNVLRLILGKHAAADEVCILETNIDDVSGEVIAYAAEKLRNTEGVLDVWIISGIGKKGRPIIELRTLARMSAAEEVAEVIMRLTGSLGVRIVPVYHRVIAERRNERVEVEACGKRYKVRYKTSLPGFGHVKPEFDDIARICDECNLPPALVQRKIMRGIEDADPERE